jgi:hypothetical protein
MAVYRLSESSAKRMGVPLADAVAILILLEISQEAGT